MLPLRSPLNLRNLSCSLANNEWRGKVPRIIWGGIAILVFYPAVQMIPVPIALWAVLPGHDPYARVLDFAGVTSSFAVHSLSVNSLATEYAWLVLLPCIAIFLLVQSVPRQKVRQLVVLFIVVAVCEAALGSMQVGAGRNSFLYLGNIHGGGAATGTYVNRNHFAALMAMALPVLLALWANEILPNVNHLGESLREHPSNADTKLALRILWSFLIVLVFLALLLTRSRTGIACGFLAFALAGLYLVWGVASRSVKITLGLVALAALLLAGYVGLTPILERFHPEDISLGFEGRMRIVVAALHGGLDFFPFGSGLGTFADVFPRFQSGGVAGFVDHAHNDYIEAFFELGIAGVIVIALFGVAYVQRWRSLYQNRNSRSLGYLRIGAGFGMLAFIIHAAFDFNAHIPANAIYFSFLAGIFMTESQG